MSSPLRLSLPAALSVSPARVKIGAPLLAVVFAIGLIRLLVLASAAESPALETAYLFNALSIGLWGTLASLLLWSRAEDGRAWLFALTATAVSATIVFPTFEPPPFSSGAIHLYLFSNCLISFFNPPIIMHMCGSIPSRNPLLARHPQFLVAAYLAASLLVVLFTIANVNAVSPFLPWQLDLVYVDAVRLKSVLIAFIISGAVGLLLLGYSALNESTLTGRRQAWVVFAGVAPWTVNLLFMLFVPSYSASDTGSLITELTILLSALSLFISIARYRLFEVSSALRRALIYGGSFGLVVGAIAIGVQAIGSVSQRLLGGTMSGWSTIVVLLIGGMAAQPLFAAFTRAIDSRLFPERKRLELLRSELIPSLAAERSVDGMSKVLVSRLSLALHDAHVTLLLLDPSGEFYRGRASNIASTLPVLPAEWLSQSTDALSQGITLERDRDAEPAAMRAALDAVKAEYIMPISLDHTPIGMALIGQSNGWRLEQNERAVLSDIGRQSSAMLENVRLLDLATTDPLTRLARRHVAEERIAHELERCSRSGAPLAIGMADIDHFKLINDTYGHAAGDIVLQAVARTLVDASRRIDLVARWGGEEFLLIFPETDLAGALTHANALRQAVEAQSFPAGPVQLSVTISIGVSEVGAAQPMPVEQAIARVDRALYHAKEAGRNRVASE